jgi:hypothetical protein
VLLAALCASAQWVKESCGSDPRQKYLYVAVTMFCLGLSIYAMVGLATATVCWLMVTAGFTHLTLQHPVQSSITAVVHGSSLGMAAGVGLVSDPLLAMVLVPGYVVLALGIYGCFRMFRRPSERRLL